MRDWKPKSLWDELLRAFHGWMEEDHDVELGRLLGYPRCCVEAYVELPPPRRNVAAFAQAFARQIGDIGFIVRSIMSAVFASTWTVMVVFLPLLLMGRALHGFGLSNYSTASSAFLADIAPPRRRAEAMGARRDRQDLT